MLKLRLLHRYALVLFFGCILWGSAPMAAAEPPPPNAQEDAFHFDAQKHKLYQYQAGKWVPKSVLGSQAGDFGAKHAGGAAVEYIEGVATDSDGNVYVAGYFEGGNTSIGGQTIDHGGAQDAFVWKLNKSGVTQWVRHLSSSNNRGEDRIYDIAVDGSGNVYVVGGFYFTLSFGNSVSLTASSYQDAFVWKLNSSGTTQWAKAVSGSGDNDYDAANAVAVDGSGNVYALGDYSGSMSFAGSTITSNGNDDIFVAKWNSSGVEQWAVSAGGTGGDSATELVVDGSGNVYVSGGFSGIFNVGGTSISSTETEFFGADFSTSDGFVWKLNSSGTHQWVKEMGGEGSLGSSIYIAVDASDDVYVTGTFPGKIGFEGSTDSLDAVAGGDTFFPSKDIFVWKLNSSGVYQWAKRTGDADNEAVDGIVAMSGHVYVAGNFNGTAPFGSTSLTSDDTDGNNAYVWKLAASDGSHVSAKKGGGTANIQVGGVSAGGGNVFVGGRFHSTKATFDGVDLSLSSGASNYDIYVWQALAGEVAQRDPYLFVDAGSAATDPDGSTWAKAYSDLAEAIGAAEAGDTLFVKGGGVFKPTSGTDANDGGLTKRDSTFKIGKKLAIYGGFAGTETGSTPKAILALRPTSFVKDTLSGDIGTAITTLGDFSDAGYDDNSKRVVDILLGGAGAVLDGFVIEAGSGGNSGTGIRVQANAVLRNLEVRYNKGSDYGAVSLQSGTMSHSVIHSNRVTGTSAEGGGMYVNASSAVLSNSAVYNNETPDSGSMGAGVYVSAGTLINVTIQGNTSGGKGGGLYFKSSSETQTVANTLIYGNTASSTANGHEVFNNNGSGTGPTFAYNLVKGADESDAIKGEVGHVISVSNCQWAATTPYVSTTKTDANFLRLVSGSSALNTGDDSRVTNLSSETDLAGNARKSGTAVDIGAYEGAFAPAPTIGSFSPTSGAVGESVTITGTNFGNDASAVVVKFHNDVTATVTSVTATQIVTTVPTGAVTGAISVTKGGQTVTSSTNFTVISKAITAITLSQTSVANGTAADVKVADLSATHSGLGANPTITYSIKNSNSATDTFKIDGTQLKTNKVIDYYKLNGTHSAITIIASHTPAGQSAITYEESFTITITPPAITAITLSQTSVGHGTAADVKVADLSTTHSGLGANPTITYSIKDADAATDTFKIVGTELKTNKAIDYDKLNAAHSAITIVASHTPAGQSAITYEESFTITITAPTITGITLTGSAVAPHLAVNTKIGVLTATGTSLPTDGHTGITFTIAEGNDAGYFKIGSNRELQVAKTLVVGDYDLKFTATHAGVTYTNATAISVSVRAAANIYVDADASGTKDGSSWTNAYDDLNLAIAGAAPGDTLLVKGGGTFKPTADTDRKKRFVIDKPIAVYGGFAGTETNAHERPTTFTKPILSGDIGTAITTPGDLTDAGYSDNSYRVINVAPGTGSGILDGFVITGGNADGTDSNTLSAAGVGIFSGATVRNAEVHSNKANVVAGGVYVIGGTLANSVVRNNQALSGAGVFIPSGTVTNSVIHNNTSSTGGGGIRITGGTVTNSTVRNNTATTSGGGVQISGGTLSNSDVYSNTATNNGGGVIVTGGTVTASKVYSNTASGNGGGVYVSAGTVSHSELYSNTTNNTTGTSLGGGAVVTGTGTLSYSVIRDNTVMSSGASNTQANGGGVYISGQATLLNATLYNNTSTDGNASAPHREFGGGLYLDGYTGNGAWPKVSNTIIYGNNLGSGTNNGTEVYNNNSNTGATSPFTYNLVKGANQSAAIFGTSNHVLGVSKCFFTTTSPYASTTSTNANFLRLANTSLAVNGGDNSLVSGVTNDLAGNTRLQHGTVDIGAYESSVAPSISAITVSATSVNHGAEENTRIAGLTITHIGVPRPKYILTGDGSDTLKIGGTNGDELQVKSATIDYGLTVNGSIDSVAIKAYYDPDNSDTHDAGEASFTKEDVYISVTAPAISSVSVSGSSSIVDGTVAGTEVGTLSSSGTLLPDDGAGITYSITAGNAGETFEIDGATLKVKTPPNRSITSTYTLTIQASYSGVQGSSDLTITITAATPKVIYVDAGNSDATTKDGTTWANAYDSLNLALAAANGGDTIFVKGGGTFKPQSTAASVTDRTKSFVIDKTVAIYGGLAGTETGTSEEILAARPTTFTKPILSGDIGTAISTLGDFTDAGYNDNSYHVVHVTAAGAVLDGFVIVGGNASVPGLTSLNKNGGGVYIDIAANAGNASLRNLEVHSNTSVSAGGGVFIRRGTLSHSVIHSNRSLGGGGVFVSSGTLSHSVIYSNTSSGSNAEGGGVRMTGGTLSHSVIHSNTSSGSNAKGGGVSMAGSTLLNITLYGNEATDGDSDTDNEKGGGLYAGVNYFGGTVVANTLIYGNSLGSGTNGSEVYNANDNPSAKLTFSHNLVKGASESAAIKGVSGHQITVSNCVFTTTDPFATTLSKHARFLHLKTGSAGLNAGDDSRITNLSTEKDLAGNARKSGSSVDIGAYEGAFAPVALTAVTLSKTSVDHGTAADTKVADLSATHSGLGDNPTITYSLKNADATNDTFKIDGAELKTNKAIDYDKLNGTHSAITIVATHVLSGGAGTLTQEHSVAITITAPTLTGISLSTTTVGSNAAVNDKVGDLTATGTLLPSDGHTGITFTITGGNTAGYFKIGNDRELQVAKALVAGDYDLVFTASYAGVEYEHTAIRVTVSSLAITGITLSKSSVAHLTAADVKVADLSATHVGIGNTPTITYSIKDADAATDTFKIDGTELKTNKAIDYYKLNGTHSAITIVASHTPQGGNALSFERAFVITITPPAPKTIYVDADASGTKDGTTWAKAYDSLNLAIAGANPGDTIFVKGGGTFKPQSPTASVTNRAYSFSIDKAVAIYGGFAGTETGTAKAILAARPTSFTKPILSGDIGAAVSTLGDFTDAGYDDNSYIVVRVAAVGAVLDGFVIVGGNANHANSPVNTGGGVWMSGGNSLLRNLEVHSNTASTSGGGVWMSGGTLSHSVIHSNTASASGGGVWVSGGTLSHSVIHSNTSGGSGGGVSISSGTVLNATIYNNTATDGNAGTHNEKGGGLYLSGSSAVVANTLIYGNSLGSGTKGPEVYNSVTSGTGPTFANNLVKGASESEAIKGATNHEIQVSDCVFTTADPYATTLPKHANFLRLRTGSAGLNAGDDSRITNLSTEKDLAGNARKSGSAVDIGAYEGAFAPVALTAITLSKTAVDHGTAADTKVADLSATHSGLGDNPTITYSLKNADATNDTFKIDGTELKTNKAIDYDKLNGSHSAITIVATHVLSGGAGTLTQEHSVAITITAPTLTGISLSTTSVESAASVNTKVGDLTATGTLLPSDGHTGITFTITDGNDAGYFKIGNDRELQVAKALVVGTYDLKFSASYLGVSYTTATAIQVSVTQTATITAITLSKTAVDHGTAADVKVADLSATHLGIGNTPTITYSIKNANSATDTFKIDGTELKTNKAIDYYKLNGSHSAITIIASHTPAGQNAITYEEAFTITITPPAITAITLSQTSVAHLTAADVKVADLSATNLGLGDNPAITYSLKGANSSTDTFKVVGSELKTNKVIDYDKLNGVHSAITLVASHTPTGESAITYEEAFTITITPPTLTGIALDGNAASPGGSAGDRIGTLTATGSHLPTDGHTGITFTLESENDGTATYFQVGSGNELQVKTALVEGTYNLVFKASYIGVEYTHTAIQVTVTQTPTITDISISATSVSHGAVEDTKIAGLSVTTLGIATPNIVYSLTGDGSDTLKIGGANNDSLLVKSATIDYGLSVNGYIDDITIKAYHDANNNDTHDTDEPSLSKAVSISVTAPTITDISLSPTSVESNASVNDKVGDLSATGTLLPSDGHTGITFTITDGNDAGYFKIGNDRELQVAKTLVAGDYDLKFKASYVGVEYTTATAIRVTVTDANVAPTGLSPASANVAENTTGKLVDLGATDPNAGDTHTFTLTSTVFEIKNDDELHLKSGQALDYETATSHSLSITVTDAGGLTGTFTFTLTVTNVNESPTGLSPSTASVSESTTGKLVDLGATDPDASDTHTFTLTSTLFEIQNGNELHLKSGQALDYETAASHSLSITVTDAGGLTGTFTFTLKVLPTIANAIFVDAGATGTKDGSSWANAYDSLNVAITNATAGDTIFVKGAGTFKPTNKADRTKSFTIDKAIAIYGGFLGTETGTTAKAVLAARPTSFVKDTLSGDIGTAITTFGDITDTGYGDNSYRVVHIPSSGAGAVLDGFVIEGGHANEFNTLRSQGGGVYMEGNATLRNLEVHGNISSRLGGGVYMLNGVVSHSVIHSNRITGIETYGIGGGGVYMLNGVVSHSVIHSNRVHRGISADGAGGGVSMDGGTLTHSVIYNNISTGSFASRGGGVQLVGGTFSHSAVYSNTGSNGGGVSVVRGLMLNVTVYDNTATQFGGGLYISSDLYRADIVNTLIYGNNLGDGVSSTNGKEVYNYTGARRVGDETPNFVHNLVKGSSESDAIKGAENHRINVSNSVFTEAYQFASETVGNASFLRLASGAAAIDAGDDSRISNIDSETDLAGNARKSGAAVDIGAYEGAFTPVSKITAISLSGTAVNVNASVNDRVGDLTATGQHLPSDGHTGIAFTITEGNTAGYFKIGNGHELQVAKALVVGDYNLKFKASYAGVEYTTATAVRVAVTDVNVAPTNVRWNIAGANRYVSEDTLSNARLAKLLADDPDAFQNVNFRIRSSVPAGAPFAFDNATDSLYISGNLNFETQTSYLLRIEAYDNGTPSLTSNSTFDVTIHILDGNDAPTDLTPVSHTAAEDLALGSTIAILTLTDEDWANGQKGTIAYTVLPTSAQDTFAVEESNGTIALKVKSGGYGLDYEHRSHHNIRVRVVDNYAGTIHIFTKAMVVRVTDVAEPDDIPTNLTLTGISAGVSAQGTNLGLLSNVQGKIGVISATPPSGVSSSSLHYGVEGSDVFGLRNGNELHAVQVLDPDANYTLSLKAFYYKDPNNPSNDNKAEATRALAVNVVRDSDIARPSSPGLSNLTTGVSGSGSAYEVLVGKSGSLGDVSVTYTGTTPLVYTLSSQLDRGTAVSIFTLNAQTGALGVSRTLTASDEATYSLAIEAGYDDAYGITRSVSYALTIEVLSSPPASALGLSSSEVGVQVVGTNLRILSTKSTGKIGTLSAAPPTGVSTLQYSVSGSSVFEIQNNNELHTNATLSASSTYELTLSATYDNALGTSISTTSSLDVAVVDDATVPRPTDLTLTELTTGVSNTTLGNYEVYRDKTGELGTLSATYKGAESLTYTIASQSNANFFQIGGTNNNKLLVSSGNTMSSGNTYTVNVKVAYTDVFQSERSATASLSLEVVDSPKPSDLSLTNASQGVYVLGPRLKILDNATSKLGELSADLPSGVSPGTSLTYGLGSGTSSDFSIENGNELHVSAALTAGNSYTLILTASYTNSTSEEVSTSLTMSVEVVSNGSIATPTSLVFENPTAGLRAKSATEYDVLVGKQGVLGDLDVTFGSSEPLTYSVVSQSDDQNTADLNLFKIGAGNTLSLTSGSVLSLDLLKRQYSVELKAAYTDIYQVERSATLTLTLGVIIEITELRLSGNGHIAHLAAGNATVGTLSAEGLPPTAQANYALYKLDNPTQTLDPALPDTFKIVDDELRVGSFPPDQSIRAHHRVGVRVSYQGFTRDSVFVIAVGAPLKFLPPENFTFVNVFRYEVPFSGDKDVNSVFASKDEEKYGIFVGKEGYLGDLRADAPTPPADHILPATISYTLLEQKTSDNTDISFENLELLTEVFELNGHELHLSGVDYGGGGTKYRVILGASYVDVYYVEHWKYDTLDWVVLNTPPPPLNFAFTPDEGSGIRAESKDVYEAPESADTGGGKLADLSATTPNNEPVIYEIVSQTENGILLTGDDAIFEINSQTSELNVKAGKKIKDGVVYEINIRLTYTSTNNALGLELVSAPSQVSLKLKGVKPPVSTLPSGLAFTEDASLKQLSETVAIDGQDVRPYEVKLNKGGTLGTLSITNSSALKGQTIIYHVLSQRLRATNADIDVLEVRNGNALHLKGEWGSVGTEYVLTIEAYYENKVRDRVRSTALVVVLKVAEEDNVLPPGDLALFNLAQGAKLTSDRYEVPKNMPNKRRIGVLSASTPKNKTFTYALEKQVLVSASGSEEQVDIFGLMGEGTNRELQLNNPLGPESTLYKVRIRLTYTGGQDGNTPISGIDSLWVLVSAPAADSSPTLLSLIPSGTGVQYIPETNTYALAKNKGGKVGVLRARAPQGKLLSYTLKGQQTNLDVFEIQDAQDLHLRSSLGEENTRYNLDVEVSYVNELGDAIRAPLVLPLRVAAEEQISPSNLIMEDLVGATRYNSKETLYEIAVEAPVGKLGALRAQTPSGKAFTYTLLNSSDTFAVENGNLQLKQALRTIGNKYLLTIKVAYSDNAEKKSNLPLVLKVVPERITGLALSGNGQVAHGAETNTAIGNLSTAGLSPGLSATYALLNGTDTFKISSNGQLQVGATSPNHNHRPTHALRVRATYKNAVYEHVVRVVVGEPTGLHVPTLDKGTLEVYPNPADELVSVKGLSLGAWLRVWASDARLVYEVQAQRLIQAIDLRHLPPGTYVIEVTHLDGVIRRATLLHK